MRKQNYSKFSTCKLVLAKMILILVLFSLFIGNIEQEGLLRREVSLSCKGQSEICTNANGIQVDRLKD